MKVRYWRIDYLSTRAFPGQPSSVVYLSGCPFSCFYCSGGGEVRDAEAGQLAERLIQGAELVDALVVGGCEPLVQESAIELLTSLAGRGMKLKVCTSGFVPELLERTIELNLVDAVELYLRAPLETEMYARVTGRGEAVDRVFHTLNLLSSFDGVLQVSALLAPPIFTQEYLRELSQVLRRMGFDRLDAVHWWDAGHIPATSESREMVRTGGYQGEVV